MLISKSFFYYLIIQIILFLNKNIEEDSMNFSEETKNIDLQSNSNLFRGSTKFID